MKVFVDECTGWTIGKALSLVGVNATWVGTGGAFKFGDADELWLPPMSRKGYLILSRNIGIYFSDAQRQLLLDNKGGIVFVPDGMSSFMFLELLFRKWKWLEAIDKENRPFAYYLSESGSTTWLSLKREELNINIARRPPKAKAQPVNIPSPGDEHPEQRTLLT